MDNSAANSTLPDARPPILIAAVLLVSAAMVTPVEAQPSSQEIKEAYRQSYEDRKESRPWQPVAHTRGEWWSQLFAHYGIISAMNYKLERGSFNPALSRQGQRNEDLPPVPKARERPEMGTMIDRHGRKYFMGPGGKIVLSQSLNPLRHLTQEVLNKFAGHADLVLVNLTPFERRFLEKSKSLSLTERDAVNTWDKIRFGHGNGDIRSTEAGGGASQPIRTDRTAAATPSAPKSTRKPTEPSGPPKTDAQGCPTSTSKSYGDRRTAKAKEIHLDLVDSIALKFAPAGGRVEGRLTGKLPAFKYGKDSMGITNPRVIQERIVVGFTATLEDGEFTGGPEGTITGNFRYTGFVPCLPKGFHLPPNNRKGFFLHAVVNANGTMTPTFGFSGAAHKVASMCFERFDGGGTTTTAAGQNDCKAYNSYEYDACMRRLYGDDFPTGGGN